MINKLICTIVLSTAILFFILGISYPILSTKQEILRIVLKSQEVKLFDSVRMFYESGDYLLAIIIFLFTIVLPIVKFIELFNRIFTLITIPSNINKTLHLLDKWSMLDVFLVALLMLNFKMDSNIIVMKLMSGTTFIALSIIVRMLTSTLIDKLVQQEEQQIISKQ